MARTVMSMLGHGRTLAFDEADAAGVGYTVIKHYERKHHPRTKAPF
jgi:hypothetical protein